MGSVLVVLTSVSLSRVSISFSGVLLWSGSSAAGGTRPFQKSFHVFHFGKGVFLVPLVGVLACTDSPAVAVGSTSLPSFSPLSPSRIFLPFHGSVHPRARPVLGGSDVGLVECASLLSRALVMMPLPMLLLRPAPPVFLRPSWCPCV